ncbi:GntR family transcriptional regulator [Leucobacter rhizosphaerae]|uniref:GntR family transcriptional regulator n=1 Tax=Leucobacter rhizosphaerae TaxID=2932245 RepID=A0ABY4FTJ3_9MICO|nr:GntR family transcriptional regulator [Leucobacter rhizosphaerae]UOQ59580.1 GntR family transcriptional regulator [Leucobacter rhizosphaerae]
MPPSFALPESSIQRSPALLRDQVAEYLREAIFHLALAPGTPLVEREICEATTASRATVREALRQLESEGLVRSIQGKGTIVAGLTATEAQEIYEIRAQLEGLAARLFVERASDKLVRALQNTLVELAEVVDQPADMIAIKADFYDVLFAGAGNGELQRLLHGLRQRITLAQSNSLAVPGRGQQSLAELQEIVSALARRDADEAVRLTVEHINEASRAVRLFREGNLEEYSRSIA